MLCVCFFVCVLSCVFCVCECVFLCVYFCVCTFFCVDIQCFSNFHFVGVVLHIPVQAGGAVIQNAAQPAIFRSCCFLNNAAFTAGELWLCTFHLIGIWSFSLRKSSFVSTLCCRRRWAIHQFCGPNCHDRLLVLPKRGTVRGSHRVCTRGCRSTWVCEEMQWICSLLLPCHSHRSLSSEGNATMTNCHLERNVATASLSGVPLFGSGGAIAVDGISLIQIIDCIFVNNSGLSALLSPLPPLTCCGGGFVLSYGHIRPSGTTVQFIALCINAAAYGGCLSAEDFGNVTVTGCTFTDSNATLTHGGVRNLSFLSSWRGFSKRICMFLY